MTVLLFGFGPFLAYDENPTEVAVRRIDGARIGGEDVAGVVLPVDYAKVEGEIVSAIDRVRPRLAIGFGLAQGRVRVTPEKVAVNCRYSQEPDNSGTKAAGAPIDAGGPDGIFSNLRVEALADSLNSIGVPAAVSFSAGAYLCNNAMYVIVREARRRGFLGGFVHVPCHSEWVSSKNRPDPSLPIDTIEKAARHAVEFSLRGA